MNKFQINLVQEGNTYIKKESGAHIFDLSRVLQNLELALILCYIIL